MPAADMSGYAWADTRLQLQMANGKWKMENEMANEMANGKWQITI
jgi:hypothetical protein